MEREWLGYGHRFSDRCGQTAACTDVSQRCPIFLQWLDCVHQLLLQFPCDFEFNQNFLVGVVWARQWVWSKNFGGCGLHVCTGILVGVACMSCICILVGVACISWWVCTCVYLGVVCLSLWVWFMCTGVCMYMYVLHTVYVCSHMCM